MRAWQLHSANSRKRSGSLHLVGILLVAAALPALLSVTTRSDAASLPVTVPCDGYLVQMTKPLSHPGLATISKGEHVLRTIQNYSIANVQCRNLTGDLVPDLLISEFTGGAHYCTIVQVFALEPFRRVLFYRDGGAFDVRRNVNGRFLVLSDRHFDFFEDLCGPCSPASVPFVACYDGSRFRGCTSQHPDIVAVDAGVYTEELRNIVHAGSSQDPEYTE